LIRASRLDRAAGAVVQENCRADDNEQKKEFEDREQRPAVDPIVAEQPREQGQDDEGDGTGGPQQRRGDLHWRWLGRHGRRSSLWGCEKRAVGIGFCFVLFLYTPDRQQTIDGRVRAPHVANEPETAAPRRCLTENALLGGLFRPRPTFAWT